jgi:hypothetical protein
MPRHSSNRKRKAEGTTEYTEGTEKDQDQRAPKLERSPDEKWNREVLKSGFSFRVFRVFRGSLLSSSGAVASVRFLGGVNRV